MVLFKRLTQGFRWFLYSFWDISVLFLKSVLLSVECFIIFLCKFFVINLFWFALRCFCFIGVCLFDISIKILRKFWNFILLSYHVYDMSSSWALNSSLQNLQQSLWFTTFCFSLGKYYFRNVVVSLSLERSPFSKTLLFWKLCERSWE